MQPHIFYILKDMIPSSYGSSLFQDSSLNKTSGVNCYILGYKSPNENFEDVPKMERNLLSQIQFSDPSDETVTCGSPYTFVVLNSPITGHLGKMIISPNW